MSAALVEAQIVRLRRIRHEAAVLRAEAAAVPAEAAQRRRQGQLTAIIRCCARPGRELAALGLEIEVWDGTHPPLQHLIERLETVEVGLDEIEARLRALRPRSAN